MKIVNNTAENMFLYIEKESIDMIITSPPYDNLRDYKDNDNWNWKTFTAIAENCYNALKKGGVMVWIVNDKYINGSRSLTTWKQLIYFVDKLGFSAHDIMVWMKPSPSFPASGRSNRYGQQWEPMLVLSKGKPKTHNLIKDVPKKYFKSFGKTSVRQTNGEMKQQNIVLSPDKFGYRSNIWKANTSSQENPTKKIPHPATFPIKLIQEQIQTWTNEGDIVLDPFGGYGTTLIASNGINRNSIMFEISKEYCELTKERIKFTINNKTWLERREK